MNSIFKLLPRLLLGRSISKMQSVRFADVGDTAFPNSRELSAGSREQKWRQAPGRPLEPEMSKLPYTQRCHYHFKESQS